MFTQVSLHAQADIKQFVLYGKHSTQIGTSTTINGGKVGSLELVTTIGNSNITADIHSDNLVQLANSNTIRGNITAANRSKSGGLVFSTGSNFSLVNNDGQIHAGGNVSIQSGSIRGTLYMPSSSTYNGPTVKRNPNPVFPAAPPLPAITAFPASGTENITQSRSIDPNVSYGDLVLNGNQVVTFSGPGVYTFKRIKISGTGNRLVLDFKDKTSEFIVIQVHNDADFDKVNVQLVNGGSASRVFTEVQGNGSSSLSGNEAFRIANGSSGTNQIIWYGTVWAPNGGIFIGQGASSFKVDGALWSGTNVVLGSGVAVNFVQQAPCRPPVANAGADKNIICPAKEVSIGTTNNQEGVYKWETMVDGTRTVVGTQQVLTVSKPGTYWLTVANSCGSKTTDEVVVGYQSCIVPINNNNEKVDNVIGHELTNLQSNLSEAQKHLVILGDNNEFVLIEAVAVIGKETEAKNFLVGLGLTDLIPNGLAYQVISGKFPVANLLKINDRKDLINHARPVFLPQGNAGIVTSEGDKAIAANLARGGFTVAGEGIKIGVISDSYNRNELSLDKARQDVLNGDLPGTGNPEGNTQVVDVVTEYPYGQRSDEGRAMLQIIHDLAPKADLAFATGFLSAGHMAQSIYALKEAGCKVIVDDVTYITEPFFQDGIIARTVNEVSQNGVTYFTSAGNFGQRAYTNTFKRAPAPAGLTGFAHDFGSGDTHQRLKLKSGTYSIVLQWQDNIYSLGQNRGTINDLDIYLIDPSGRIGFNRNNLAGDPFEVLSFSINLPDTSQVIEADLVITKADNSLDNPLFKYIIFRGNAVVEEYYAEQPLVNKSTIVGHANAEGAIAVGAVLFSNTEPYGNTPSIASFSSTGGTPVFTNGVSTVRRKPEITAPNGVNTSPTVVMGPDRDFVTDPVNGTADGFPNFYGTSASAPHAAAAAALVMSARNKFYSQSLSTDQLRYYLFETAKSMQPDGVSGGWNYKAGYGLVQPDGAIRAFANPTPKLTALVYDANIVPGAAPFVLKVTGEYFSDNSVIYFRGSPLSTLRLDDDTLQATIPQFSLGNPAINVYTPSFPGATGDGGLSNTLYFFTIAKLKVNIKADNKTKKYGEVLPANSFTIFVEGDSLHVYNQKFSKNLTPESLGLSQVNFRYVDPAVNPLSDVGTYRINVSRTFDLSNTVDIGLLEIYTYDSLPGNLQVNRLPVTLSPIDLTVQYGDALGNFNFNYEFDPSANIANLQALTAAIRDAHNAHVDNSVLGIMNGVNGGAAIFFQNRILPVYSNAAIIYQNKLYPVLSGTTGNAVVIINGTEYSVANSLLSGGAVVVLNGEEYPVINGGGAVVILNGQIVPVVNRTGGAVVVLNGQEYPVVNRVGGAVVVLNGEEFPIINGGGGAVVVLNGQYLPVINSLRSGGAVVVLNGEEYPVINSLRSGGAVVVLNGEEVPVISNMRTAVTVLNGKMYDVELNRTGGAVVVLNGVVQAEGVPYLNGVGGGAVVVLNGQTLPVINRVGGAVVVLNGVDYAVLNRSGGAVVVLNGQELPLVNSVSQSTLNNLSTSATLNAIANARSIDAQPNKFIDVTANAFVQFNANSSESTLSNALASVNARALVDANRLANGETVLVNTRTTAVTVLNGSGAYVNSNTLSSTTQKTPVVVDQADLNSASGNIATISMNGINMITGINSGEQYVIPATLYSPNFDVTYKAGTVTISQAPLNLKANNLTKVFGETIAISPTGFGIAGGTTKYTERISLAAMASQGAVANASPGSYPITITNALGSYGTDMNNYNVTYTNGTLQVLADECPVITHSRDNNFVSTSTAPVSLWLNVQIKVRGQLAKANDSIVLRGGRLVLENVSRENGSSSIIVPRGLVIAKEGVTAPVTRFDVKRGVFITLVPVGFSSTADIFITGAIINSNTGFIKGKNAGSVLSGTFQSNVSYNGQWNYAMAAYKVVDGRAYVQYAELANEGNVVAMSGSFKAGTPMPWLTRITAGGTGNGGTNYTGSATSNDNFPACVITALPGAANRNFITSVAGDLKDEKKIVASDKELLVFPNPANAFVTISFVPPASGRAVLRIYSAAGTQVQESYQGIAQENKIYTRRIDTQPWPKGVYIVQLVVKNQTITRKLVISP